MVPIRHVNNSLLRLVLHGRQCRHNGTAKEEIIAGLLLPIKSIAKQLGFATRKFIMRATSARATPTLNCANIPEIHLTNAITAGLQRRRFKIGSYRLGHVKIVEADTSPIGNDVRSPSSKYIRFARTVTLVLGLIATTNAKRCYCFDGSSEALIKSQKIDRLAAIANSSRQNGAALRTWTGRYSYEMAFHIPARTFDEYLKTVSPETENETLDPSDEFVVQSRVGEMSFKRDFQADKLSLHIQDRAPHSFRGSATRHNYLNGNIVRNERAVITNEGIYAYKPELFHRLPPNPTNEMNDGRQASTAISSSPRRRLDGPVWALDTNPWTGEYIDPGSFFGIDRPIDAEMNMYIRALQGDFGEAKSELANQWVKVADGTGIPGSVAIEIHRPELLRTLEFDQHANLVRYTEQAPSNDSRSSSTIKEMTWQYRQDGGIALPERIQRKLYSPGTSKLASDIQYVLTESAVNVPIDGATFEKSALEAPADAWMLIEENGQPRLEPPPTAPRKSTLLSWLVMLNLGIGFIILAFYLMRRKTVVKT